MNDCPNEESIRQPGERAGNYEILGALGQGAMGVVYKARRLPDGSLAALKFPRRLSPEDMPGYIRRFRNEAQIALGLRHPNIVAVYEVAEDNDDVFMAMEYVEGKPLSEALKDRPIVPLAAALRIALQSARALEEIHSRGVVHRDIKPSNLMLAVGGVAKLTDFGVAKMRIRSRDDNQSYLEGEIVGTPYYLAPEQSLGHRSDHRVDIYALGVSLFRMLAGRVPYDAPRVWELFRKILDSRIPSVREFNPDAPEVVDRIITRAMAKRPEERQETAAQLAQELQGALDDLEVFF